MESADRKKLAKKLAFVADPIIETIKELERVDFELSETNSKIDLIQDDSTKIVEAINHLDQTKADKEDVAQQIENIARMPGRPGNPGRDGKDYILTPKDKEEIASKIKVPVVEKVIERTEVIKEQPIIKTEVVKEITQDLDGTAIIERINGEKDTLIKREKIEGLDKKLTEASNEILTRATSILDQRTQFLLNKQTSSGSSTDEKVKLSASDPTAGYLDAKLNEGVTGVKAKDSAGFHIHNASGQDVALFGLGGGQNSTFYDGVKLDAGTASRVLVTDSNKNISYSTITDTQLVSAVTGSMTFIIGDGANTITAGTIAYLPQMPYAGTITGWYLSCVTSPTPIVGSIVLDVWKDTTGNYPPTVADTIAGSEKPTLSSQTTNSDTDLTTWTTSFNTGDCFGVKVDSVSGCRKVLLTIKFNKS